jgi:glutamate--cysteine ligase
VRHRDQIWRLPFDRETAARFARLAEGSLVKQRQIEAADTLPFEAYRQQYLSAARLQV